MPFSFPSIARRRAEKMLMDLANLPNVPGYWPGLNLYSGDLSAQEILQERVRGAPARRHAIEGYGPHPTYERFFQHWPNVIAELALTEGDLYQLQAFRNLLRMAWDASDLRVRDWYIFKLRDHLHRHAVLEDVVKALAPGELPLSRSQAHEAYTVTVTAPPALTPVEKALAYFQRGLENKSLHCQSPQCLTPYFLAQKRNQRYCSQKCAGESKKESNRRSWHKHKDQWSSKNTNATEVKDGKEKR